MSSTDIVVKEVNKEIEELEKMLDEVIVECSLRQKVVRSVKKLPQRILKVHNRRKGTYESSGSF
jgi:hypothetical protein